MDKRKETKYKIIVKTFQGDILTFNVNNYNVENGYVCFIDDVKRQEKRFPIHNTEITSKIKESIGTVMRP